MEDQDTQQNYLKSFAADFRAGFVAVIGQPNVGKSTLINGYVGEKISIVSPKPQTTRRQALGILTKDNVQIIFVDTPGIHKPKTELGRYMVSVATHAIPDADLVLFVVDVSRPPNAEDHRIADELNRWPTTPVILVLNKADLLKPEDVESQVRAYMALGNFADPPLGPIETWPQSAAYGHWMLCSATRGDNRDKLLHQIVALLPQSPPLYDPSVVTDQTERLTAAELIREQVLRFLEQEVPHAVDVVISEWQERSPTLTYIDAEILVEKPSQKGIVIGAKAEMLKRIGSAARVEIEQMLEHKVFLELYVRVREKWRHDPAELRRLGYNSGEF
ncbi:MAG: GTPase Era [Chloroflexi bacterium]|nr:GTPase Era [Chloroflexota bacterium]